MGSIYLIPVPLGGNDYLKVIPEKVLELTRSLRYFIVEDVRSARRYLRLIDKRFPIDECEFFELNEHTPISETEHFLDPVLSGSDLGLMSEAGLPGVADPGALVVALAHRKKISVKPLAGPSSIILALVSSGLNGQNFTFNGYLPVKPAERSLRLRELMKRGKEGYAQIFMETPYRNQQMLESVMNTCEPGAMLCIAADLTLPSESVRTMRIADWRKNPPDLKGKLVIFILQ